MPSTFLAGAVFPAVDPIPLPAPVWLFKVLLDVTLTLHFAALYLLLGGLLGAVCRDLVRDASLARFGFDVLDRAVVVNWSVLGLFLALFIAGLGTIGWLASVLVPALL